MADISLNAGLSSGQERSGMSERLVEVAICLLIGLASLAVVVWLAFTGRLAYLDGISLALISLVIGGFFLFDVFVAYRSGELNEILGRRKAAASTGDSGKPAASSSSSASDDQ
jgi:hypothetical protein